MIKGADAVKQILRTKIGDIRSKVSASVKNIGEDIEFLAQLHAPAMIVGTIKGEYGNNPNQANYIVKVLGPSTRPQWAIWFEFGSGVHAARYVPGLPSEWQAIAREFYINGEGKTIEQPYIYPAYSQLSPRLIEQAEKIIKGQ